MHFYTFMLLIKGLKICKNYKNLVKVEKGKGDKRGEIK
jgi:hypothetical protein